MKKQMTYAMSFILVSSHVYAADVTPTRPTTIRNSDGTVQLSDPSTPSISDSAKSSSSANIMGQAGNLVTSGIMFNNSRREASRKNYGMAAMYAAMGALTLAQAAAHKQAANSGAYTGSLTDAGGTGYDYTGIEDTLGTTVPEVQTLSTNIKSLQDSGLLSKDLKTVSTPDGKTFNTSDFASESAMKNAGVPGSNISKGMATVAAAAKRGQEAAEKVRLGSLTEAAGYEEGGGGGGGSSYSSSSSSDGSYGQAAGVAGAGESPSDREPANLAGMQKDYNGEPIGIAADSIFLMVNRRYKVKEGQEAFFGEKDLLIKK